MKLFKEILFFNGENCIMAIAEIKWKLVKDTYFFDTTTCYLSEDGNHMFYSGGEKRIEILIDDLNELVRKGCAMWLELGEYDFGLDKLSKCPTTTWYGIHQMLYSLEPWGVIKESKELVRKSIKESSDVAEKIASEIDKSYWIDKLIDDLDKHYESMEKAWLKNLDKLSDEDILGIVDDCMGKSKTLVGKSEMLKNKMIDDLSKAYDDYIDDIDRQIRIGKSEAEIKDMIETTLENDIKMYLKLAYNNKASSNYFMVKFAEDNLI